MAQSWVDKDRIDIVTSRTENGKGWVGIRKKVDPDMTRCVCECAKYLSKFPSVSGLLEMEAIDLVLVHCPLSIESTFSWEMASLEDTLKLSLLFPRPSKV